MFKRLAIGVLALATLIMPTTAPMALAQEQQRTIKEVVQDMDTLLHELITLLPDAPEPPEDVQVVPAGGNLQAALDDGPLIIELEEGATYVGHFVITRDGTVLRGNGASLHVATAGSPTLRIPDGRKNVYVSDLTVTLDAYYSDVVMVGTNENTNAANQAENITLERIVVPTHRGRRGFGLHGKNITLIDCEVYDVYDPTLADSQAVWINNGEGPYHILGGRFEAASENIMVGGAFPGIQGVVASDITIEGHSPENRLILTKPLSWYDEKIQSNTKRAVKNLFELKAGQRVLVKNVEMFYNWMDAQTGWAVQLTPRNNACVDDVVFDNVYIHDVTDGINMLGKDNENSPVPCPLGDITVKNSTIIVDRTLFPKADGSYAGTGRPFQWVNGQGVHTLTIENNLVHGNNWYGHFVYHEGLADALTITNGNKILVRLYGHSYAFVNPSYANTVTVEGNIIGDPSNATKSTWPNNTWMTLQDFTDTYLSGF